MSQDYLETTDADLREYFADLYALVRETGRNAPDVEEEEAERVSTEAA